LKEVRLLEAAHIIGDIEEAGEPVVSNGLALCSIHHRAYDHDLVGVSPDYDVRISPRLLEDEGRPDARAAEDVRPATDLRPAPSEVEAGSRTPGIPVRPFPDAKHSMSRS
jgi:hypothetical protein